MIFFFFASKDCTMKWPFHDWLDPIARYTRSSSRSCGTMILVFDLASVLDLLYNVHWVIDSHPPPPPPPPQKYHPLFFVKPPP